MITLQLTENASPTTRLQDDVWELYNTEKDFSLTQDLASEEPEKLKRLQALFEKEAITNNVYPLDDRVFERFNAAVAGRPDLMGTRTSLTLSEGMDGILENTFQLRFTPVADQSARHDHVTVEDG